MSDRSYNAVMARKNEIMKQALGLDYLQFETASLSFDYEKMMNAVGYTLEEIAHVQSQSKVGNTPLFELKNITELVRSISRQGYGARILLKDEAANASGSFKARRASLSVYEAKKRGYRGVIAATSGNYGAAVASQAAQQGLSCIIIQEVFDSRHEGQPEIIEKARKCEAFGAEVHMCTVGPELFYNLLLTLEDTGFFNSSLYTPYSIAGIETLGHELITDIQRKYGKEPAAIVITHAGGGNVTGTARGAIKAGATSCRMIGASVDLSGLHMASDRDFNMKSFTTGHTGFGIPFATWPDRSDVPRNAARPLRYLDALYTVTQGEVFFATELLSRVEGIERGPAGNISLAAAISLARELPTDEIVVVQETEYTGAGKHPLAQLKLAKQKGIEVRQGLPEENVPGKIIAIPHEINQLNAIELNLDDLKRSYLKNLKKNYPLDILTELDREFLRQELRWDFKRVEDEINLIHHG